MRRIRRALIGLMLLPAGAGAQEAGPARVSLEEAIRQAVERSQIIAQSREGVRIANQQVRETRADIYPSVSADASYQRNLEVQQGFLPRIIFDPTASPDDVIPVRFGSDNTWQSSVSVNQSLFEMTVFIGLKAASRFRALEEERLRGTAQSVIANVRQAYFDALLAAENERLLELSVERTRQTLEETRALNRAGLASDYDVLRLEVQLANLEPNLRRARNSVDATRRVLAIEMGLAPETPFGIVGSLNELAIADPTTNSPENAALLAASGTAPTTSFDDLLQTAIDQRSDVRQIRMTSSLEETRLAAQRAEYFPSVSLFGTYSVTAQQNDPLNFFGTSNSRTTFAFAGVRVEVPIFQGFARSARMQQTRARIAQSDANLRRAINETSNQVRTLLDNVGEARERTIAQGGAVSEARRGFEIASAEYRAGLGSQLQITDAEVALRQSEFNYAQAVYDYLSARAQLQSALGTIPFGTVSNAES